MTTEPNNGTPPDPPTAGQHKTERLVGFREGQEKARKLFAHAQKAEQTRNYDYAIELYVQGLAYWPDAYEEGLQKLWVVATNRQRVGGKPPGFMVARKFPTGGKDYPKALNNALHLFGLNPGDISYMEQILHLSAKAHCDVVAQWISPKLTAAYKTGKKLAASHYQSACESMFYCADLAVQFENDTGAKEILNCCSLLAQFWGQQYGDSPLPPKAMSDASSKLTIVRGRFDKEGGFTSSLRNGEAQHELQDREKRVHTIDRHKQLVEQARRDWEANRSIPNKLLNLANLMTRIEADDAENEAMTILNAEYQSSGNYIFKQKSDDILMRQLNRQRMKVEKLLVVDRTNEELRQQYNEIRQLQSDKETRIFEDRVQHYPTELKVKYELALRYFQAKRYDDAIPLLQQARADAKIRAQCRLYIGRCFYAKEFHDQAVDVLRRGLEELEARSGGVFNDLNYWLARALEASGDLEGAKKVYGQLIQSDYNYRDGRQRLERLVAETKN